MSPILQSVYAAAHIDTTSWPRSTTDGAVLTAFSQEPTDSLFSASTIHMDLSIPPAMVSPVAASGATSVPMKQGMTSGTKLGLWMIPVVVCLCAMWIFFLFWWRKRRARKAITQMGPPPVPEKDYFSFDGSIGSSRRDSKVFKMAAFSTPIHNGLYRKAPVIGEGRLCDQTRIESQRDKHQNVANIACRADSASSEADHESPIDRISPFRLKRGDTVKRYSLGTEIASLWPSPPPSAWVKKQPTITD
ncbi:Nn.00g066920.m01.CDS01 [Neocucurbitaria sp. VM-36]